MRFQRSPVHLKIKLLIGLSGLVLAVGTVGPVVAHEHYKSLALSSSAYTNGTLKSFVYSGSHSACASIWGDVSVRVYYDILNTTKIHITKVLVKYWVKGSASSGVWGGTLWVTAGDGDSQQQWLPDLWGDHYKFYKYNPATRESDGYSYVGSYTHTGSATITGRSAWVVKRTNLVNSVCTGGWDFSLLKVTW